MSEYFDRTSDFEEYVSNLSSKLIKHNSDEYSDIKNNYFIDKMKYEHEERMKDKEFVQIQMIKNKELELKDKEFAIKKIECDVEIKKLELEILKLKANNVNDNKYNHITLSKKKY